MKWHPDWPPVMNQDEELRANYIRRIERKLTELKEISYFYELGTWRRIECNSAGRVTSLVQYGEKDYYQTSCSVKSMSKFDRIVEVIERSMSNDFGRYPDRYVLANDGTFTRAD